MQSAAHEPLFDIDPRTGTSIEVFFADRALETFGRCGAGWFWWCRRRGYPPERLVRWGRLATPYSGLSERDERGPRLFWKTRLNHSAHCRADTGTGV